MTWQPIETAPKDGTAVLVWFQGACHVARYAPLWNANNLRWFVNTPKLGKHKFQAVAEIEPSELQAQIGLKGPTHWAPLPDPPTEAQP